MIFITILNKVLRTSGLYLKLCHRANSVIMGAPFSNSSSSSPSLPPCLSSGCLLLGFPVTAVAGGHSFPQTQSDSH